MRGAACTCDFERRLALAEVDANLIALDPSHARTVIKADGGEQGGEEFIEEELILMSLLAAAIANRGLRAIRLIEQSLEAYGLHLDRLHDAVGEAKIIMAGTFDDVETRVSRNMNRLLIKGGILAADGEISSAQVNRLSFRGPIGAGTVLEGMPSVEQVHAGMLRSTKYYTNRFFNTQVVPAMFAEVDKVLAGTSPFDVPNIAPIREMLEDRLKNVPYWRVVANSAASRGFHYGYMKASQATGRTGYRWVSVLDDRTSEICLELNGTEFLIQNAVGLMERISQADSPDEVKTLAPWRSLEEVEGRSSQELTAMGMMFPPAHANCRSTIETF